MSNLPNSSGSSPVAPPAGANAAWDNAPAPTDPIASHTESSDIPPVEGANRAPSPPSASGESDVAQFLVTSAGDAAVNSDDAPTVITHGKALSSFPPPSLNTPAATVTDPSAIAGRRLGHFELIETIGSGGMAAVLKARDTQLGRTVALKILPPQAARDPESVTRFKQEARAAAALDHENIARVYFCGEDQGLHFIAFEFVEGINLRQLIDRQGPLPAGDCVRYMLQVAAGLNHAAERGVVHRDIKPANIIITPDGRAKIVDMGLARLDSEAVNGGVTQSGVTLGTFDYISPEQALDPRRTDVRSDIYSLGCTFYHALTGRPPVPEGTAARKLRAHQFESPLDPRLLNPAIPDELAVVLARMMAKQPAERYQTPLELIAHLKGLAERLRLDAATVSQDAVLQAVPAERQLLPPPPRLKPWWLLASCAAVLAIAAFVIGTNQPSPPPGLLRSDPAPLVGFDSPPLREPENALPKGQRPLPVTVQVRTVAELVQHLEDPNTTKIALAPGEYDLTQLDRPLRFHGKSLELVGSPLGSASGITKLILFADDFRINGTLAIHAETLILRNLWFQFVLDPDLNIEEVGITKPVGLRVEDCAKVELWDCVFTSADERFTDHEPRAVMIHSRTDTPPAIHAQRCVFAINSPAAIGLVAPSGSRLTITDSGFAPHAACVLVDSPTLGEFLNPTEIQLNHSTFMVDPGGAVIDSTASPRLTVTTADCLFAAVDGPRIRSPIARSEANRRGVMVRVRAERPDGVQWMVPNGRSNGYYRVDPIGTSRTTWSFETWKSEVPSIEDKGRTKLEQRPWAESEPLAVVRSSQPWKGFRLKVDDDAEPGIFTTEYTKDSKQRAVPLGVAFHQADNVRRAYKDLPMAWGSFRPRTAEPRKIWWPTATEAELSPGISNDLATLLKTVRPDETIYIRHHGELELDTIEIKSPTRPSDGDIRVKFAPDTDCQPVLVIQADNDRDQSLFKLKAGEVTFERLHFRLKPNRPRDEQTVAAVSIIGGKSCTFNHCIFTFLGEEYSPAAAVHLPDADKIMAMDAPARPVPRVAFHNCLLRGKGRAVWIDYVSRPVEVALNNTLTALDDALFYAQAGGKNLGGGTSSLKLTRVTALTGGPILELHGTKSSDAMRPGGLLKVEVEAAECLFVAVPNAGRPLVELDGVDPAEVKSVFSWRAIKANRYANYETSAVLAVIRPQGEGFPKEWTRSAWIDNVAEPPPDAEKRFGEIRFRSPIPPLRELVKVHPDQLIILMAEFHDRSEELSIEAGADLKGFQALPLESNREAHEEEESEEP